MFDFTLLHLPGMCPMLPILVPLMLCLPSPSFGYLPSYSCESNFGSWILETTICPRVVYICFNITFSLGGIRRNCLGQVHSTSYSPLNPLRDILGAGNEQCRGRQPGEPLYLAPRTTQEKKKKGYLDSIANVFCLLCVYLMEWQQKRNFN